MLSITLTPENALLIGDDVLLMLGEDETKGVRVAIQAPKRVNIMRITRKAAAEMHAHVHVRGPYVGRNHR